MVGFVSRIIILDPGQSYILIYLANILKLMLVYMDESGYFARFLHLSQRV